MVNTNFQILPNIFFFFLSTIYIIFFFLLKFDISKKAMILTIFFEKFRFPDNLKNIRKNKHIKIMRISMKYEKMMNIVCIIQYYMYKILEKVYFGGKFYFVK